MKIITDDAAIQKSLRAMEKTIEDHGGWIDPEMVIKCAGGALSIEKQSFPNPGRPMIALPGDLLLPTEKMGLSVRNNELLCDPVANALSGVQEKLAHNLIELYNLTGKIASHQKSCCWVTFRRTPDLLVRLLKARTLNHVQKKLLSWATGELEIDENTVLCDTYLKSRTIAHKYKGAQKTDEPEGDTPVEPGMSKAGPGHSADLMPIIDFLNHHSGGAFFSFRDGYDAVNREREFLLVNDHRPLSFTSECYAFYNQMDPIDSFVGYGFPDAFAPYIRSVPMTLDIGAAGQIVVHSQLSSLHKGKLPANAAGLRPYIPQTVKVDKESMEITHLLIPCNPAMPHALRRVLRVLISNRAAASRSLNASQVWEAVLTAEEIILRTNIAFYKDLLLHLETPTVKNDPAAQDEVGMIRYIAELQLSKLWKYNFDESHYKEETEARDSDQGDLVAAG